MDYWTLGELDQGEGFIVVPKDKNEICQVYTKRYRNGTNFCKATDGTLKEIGPETKVIRVNA